eukprot:7553311-Alexandrium_andersonii.AAC.1
MPGPFDESRRSYSLATPSYFLKSLPEAPVEIEVLREISGKGRVAAARTRARCSCPAFGNRLRRGMRRRTHRQDL